ncbi:hypothetical protein AALA24_02375 [Anaerovoracaceae bacterium 42-11]
MDKQSLVRDLKSYCNGGFITRQKLAAYMGMKNPRHVDGYLTGLERVNGKYYFIPDVAMRLIERSGV